MQTQTAAVVLPQAASLSFFPSRLRPMAAHPELLLEVKRGVLKHILLKE